MIRIAGIEKESIVDGEGFRYAIFTQGCNHHCQGCHNPETWDFDNGELIDDNSIINEVLSNPLLDGVTLSGGDPFFQAKELINLCKTLKEHNISIWAYTGFVFDEFIKFKKHEPCDERINKDMIKLLKYIDVVVDGPFILNQRSLELLHKGSTNQQIIDVKKSLKKNDTVEYKLAN